MFSAQPPERLNLLPLSRGIELPHLVAFFSPSRGSTWRRPHRSQLGRGTDIAQKRPEVRLNRLNCVLMNSKPEKTSNSLLTFLAWPVPQSEVSAGHVLFAQLLEGTCVTYRYSPAPPTSMSKRALRDWGRANVRWVRAKVKVKSNTHVELRDVASPNGCVTFSVSEASNRIVIG